MDRKPTPAAVPSSVDALLEDARERRLCRPDVGALAERIRQLDANPEALAEALAQAEPEAASCLVVAAAVAERPLDVSQLVELLPKLEDTQPLPLLLGCVRGERAEALVELVDRGLLRYERQAYLLLLAEQLSGEGEPPPRLLPLLRRLARRMSNPAGRHFLALAARRFDDPGLDEALKLDAALAARDPAGLLPELQHQLSGDPLPLLPEERPARVTSGFTVRRPVARHGRNDPCPCGSGRKYKACCLRRDKERLAAPSPVAGLTMQEYRAQAGEHLTPRELWDLPVGELRALDLEALPSRHLISAVGRFCVHSAWPEAERAIEILAGRDDHEERIDDLRHDLISSAIETRSFDVVRRQLEQLEEPEGRDSSHWLSVDLFEQPQPMLERLETIAGEGLREDADRSYDLAYSIVQRFPALGVLLIRGLVDAERRLDSEVLLNVIEEAREELGLPAEDPAHERYERLVAQADEEHEARQQAETLAEEKAELLTELRALRRRAGQSAASSQALERELEAARRQLAEAEDRQRRLARDEGRERASALGAEVERLEAKRRDLQALVEEGKEERSRLRRRLRRLRRTEPGAGDAAELAPSAASSTEAGAAEPEDGLELELDMQAHARIRVPDFEARAARALAAAEPRIARSALRLAADLAAGRPQAWSGVKQLRTADGLFSARVGIHHRLLFRLPEEPDALHVVDLIARRDLQQAILRLR